jgi:hypothetical protein
MPGPQLLVKLPRTALAILACALVAGLPGCQRKPHFVSASADSSLAGWHDSLPGQVRVLQERWSAGGAGEDAARLTAEVLLRDLRAHVGADPGVSWERRARALLDSLDVGAEFAGAPCVLIVNFFSRSDPTAGSWPWIFWCGEGGADSASVILAQSVEGQNLSLVTAASRGLASGSTMPSPLPAAPHGIAALFARRSGSGQQPMLMTWRAGARLELAQALGPDSLGGVGTGAFESPGDSGVVLATRTWQPTPRFDECATCPHLFRLRRFRWGVDGFARVEDQIVASPYVAFVQLIQALTAGDRDAALRRVTGSALLEAARRADWASFRGPWRAAPGREEGGDQMVFYRGPSEAWKVHFVRRGGEWLVGSLEPTTRVIE